jgi:DNA-directed RNA polymerase sigma subunit (sigma70/sigma32)
MRLAEGVAIFDWTARLAPWQSWEGKGWLEAEARVRRGAPALEARLRAVLAHRCGWGDRPRTLAETARELRTTPMAVARMERRAIRKARAASMEGPP